MTLNEIKNKISITPYYEELNGSGILYCADCLDILKMLPDKCVDLILCDPPYGINYKSNWTDNHDFIQNDDLGGWLNLMRQVLPEWKRILTDTGCCCCCCCGKTPVTAILTMEAIKHFNLIQTLVWKKFIGLGWRYRPAYENILVLSKSKNNYNFYDKSKACANVIEGFNQDIPQSDEHPTQKPVGLMKHLLLIHSKKDDIILDSFCGGGSTLQGAKELGRRFIGIEISEKYCAIAKKRLAQEILL